MCCFYCLKKTFLTSLWAMIYLKLVVCLSFGICHSFWYAHTCKHIRSITHTAYHEIKSPTLVLDMIYVLDLYIHTPTRYAYWYVRTAKDILKNGTVGQRSKNKFEFAIQDRLLIYLKTCINADGTCNLFTTIKDCVQEGM